jgi:hypothetical protein
VDAFDQFFGIVILGQELRVAERDAFDLLDAGLGQFVDVHNLIGGGQTLANRGQSVARGNFDYYNLVFTGF